MVETVSPQQQLEESVIRSIPLSAVKVVKCPVICWMLTTTQLNPPTKAEREESLTAKYFPHRWHPRFHPVFFYPDWFSDEGDSDHTNLNHFNAANDSKPTIVPAQPNTFVVLGSYDDSALTTDTDHGVLLDNVFLGVDTNGATNPDWLTLAHERLNEQFDAELAKVTQ